MKKVILFIFSMTFTFTFTNAQLKSEASECFELTSIVSRLAGAPEFVNNQFPNYANAIDNYFAPYTDHPLIPFMKEIRKKYGIGYNAVPNVATSFVIKNGKVTVDPNFDISRISEFDSRWKMETYNTFVKLLNDFYRKTKFKNFYMQHADLYKVAVERMDVLLKSVNQDWFVSFFGEELGNIDVFVSLCNGPGNFALPAVGKRNGSILIGSGSDQEGLPWFSNHMITVILHEFMHHHANSRMNACWDQIEPAAQKIFPHINEKMYTIGYGDARTTMYEWFNNFCVILYFRDNPNKTIRTFEQQTGFEQYRGFLWMDRSVRFMEYFHKNRDLYTTIDDYMPQLAGHINYTADYFNDVLKEYENRHPYIVEVYPAPGTTLTQDIKAIEIRFSQAMHGPHGIDIIEGVNAMPYSEDPFWKDEYTYVMPIDSGRLEKGKIYGFKLVRAFFQNRKMFAIKEDYVCTFNTGEE